MTTQLITRGTPPKLAARKPTGKPTWPMLLLAGAQKTGKSYSSAVFSTSDLIDRMFYIEVGEGAIDQYGAIPGARFEVLEHDGTFQSIARQVWAATLVPRGKGGKPHAIVLDSATEVWDLLTSEQQELANKKRNPAPGSDAPITMDQWNTAKKRWRALVDLLRSHDGPVIWTARFEEVAVMGDNGRPVEGKKQWKIRTEKNLPFEVDGVIEMPEPRKCYVTGIRSLRLQLNPGEHRLMPDFTIDGLLRELGLDEGVGQRNYVAPNPEAYVGEYEQEQAEQHRLRAQGQQSQPGELGSGSDRLRSAIGGQQQSNGNGQPTGITKAQLTALNAGLSALGYKDRPGIYALLSKELDRPIGSSADLTKAEASDLIDRIKTGKVKGPTPVPPDADPGSDTFVEEPPADWQPEPDEAPAGAR
jgi:hypothetical protein